MLKLLGAVCILGAGGWAWRRGTAERRRELDTLADVIALLDRMGEEIRLRRTSLPRLLASLSRSCPLERTRTRGGGLLHSMGAGSSRPARHSSTRRNSSRNTSSSSFLRRASHAQQTVISSSLPLMGRAMTLLSG